MLATLTDGPFDDPDWVFETKWDGFRVVALVKSGRVTLYSRNGLDLSARYPTICEALRATPHEAVFDGELVALDDAGRSRFQLLQNAEREHTRLRYCVFDLLYFDRKDFRQKTLLERKAALEATLPRKLALEYSNHVVGKGITAFNHAKRAREEGVMAKRADSRYHSGQRTREWLKVKASQGQEVVIVGFTAPRRSRQYLGSLVLAVRDGNGWRYVGRAGAGFNFGTLKSLYGQLLPLRTARKPVAAKVPDESNTTWVKPKLVAEVKFAEWTLKGEMRQPVFLGLRTDKKASDVVMEALPGKSEC